MRTVTIKNSIFRKTVILIVSLLIPILTLYAYSYQVSVHVVRENIDSFSKNRLSFFMSQMESTLDQLSKYSIIASRTPSIRNYLEQPEEETPFDRYRRKAVLEEQLNLQVATSNWNNQLTVFSPQAQEVISTDYSIQYDDIHLLYGRESERWDYQPSAESWGEAYFTRYTFSDQSRSDVLVEVRFSVESIKNMLTTYKLDSDANPIFYHPNWNPLVSRGTDALVVNELVTLLQQRQLESQGNEIVTLKGEKYVVNYLQSRSLGWYMVDYEPLDHALSPIIKSRNLFYFSIALLLILGLLASLLLYWQVQIPIKQLIRGVNGLQSGNYATRLKAKANNDFDYLFRRFNEMAAQIQQLIETVYEEKIRFREATLKQLQSQINPHFLYNCLYFIKNMANMGQIQAVTAMALNLGNYYRYTTRVESAMATLEEEIGMVENYLTIQSLRLERFHFEFDIPESLLQIRMPRLTIQPVAENAIVHGIEQSVRYGIIRITARQSSDGCRIIVEDNGVGMNAEEIGKLQAQLALPMEEGMGCGLWNVHQRLLHQFKGNSGLELTTSESGGLAVIMKLEKA